MKQFTIVTHTERWEFERAVEQRLNDGWNLHGTMYVNTNQHGLINQYTQSMWKEERL